MLRRDLMIIEGVGEWKQLDTRQINELYFPGLSRTPADRRLAVLVEAGYLRIVGRLPQPVTGGSRCLVYEVGSNGWRLVKARRHKPYKQVHPHMLRIADTNIELVTASALGMLKYGYSLEVRIGHGPNAPQADKLLTFTLPTDPEPLVCAIEVEVAEKDDADIIKKLNAYMDAWNAHANGFPYVIVVADSEDVEYKIARIVDDMGELARELFTVCRVKTYVGALLTLAANR